MLCRNCASKNTRVTCTDKYETYTKRYCRCLDCGAKFRTVEKYEFPKPGPPKNYSRPGKIARGSNHGMSILTEENILEMRQLHRAGWTLKELKDKFGVSSSYISKIVNYKQWTHVP
jgi:transcriptional regulator NrdR family protein